MQEIASLGAGGAALQTREMQGARATRPLGSDLKVNTVPWMGLPISNWISGFGAVAAALVLCAGAAIGQERFTGRVTIGVEAERKTCTNCGSDEHENEIETTPIELVLRPIDRPDLSFGLELEHDVESEGNFFGSGRTDAKIKNAVTLWARREFSDTVWARVQGEYQSEEKSFDLGARVGFQTDLPNDREFSAYLNVDRRFAIGSDSTADEGVFLEVRAEHEWDWDEFGAWIEVRAERWFYRSDAVEDETRVTLQPGLWFELGQTDHTGLIWFETERRRRLGASDFKRRANLIGVGVEFDLGNRKELLAGVTFGREIDTQLGRAEERKRVTGLVLEFQTRF